MAYADKERQREVSRLAMQRKRQGLTKGLTEDGETLELVNPSEEDVVPSAANISQQDAGWSHVIEFIKRPARPGDTPNLLKLQRIAGALAHCSKACDDIPTWFGSLGMREIGKFLGTAEYNMPPSGPPMRVM